MTVSFDVISSHRRLIQSVAVLNHEISDKLSYNVQH